MDASRDGGRKGIEVEMGREMKGGLEVKRERDRGRDGERVGERDRGRDGLMDSWVGEMEGYREG
jgi:hypothetical protein